MTRRTVNELLADTPSRRNVDATARSRGHETMRRNGAYIGATDTIRQALRAHGWLHGLTRDLIAYHTGLPLSVVKTGTNHMTGGGGGVIAFGKRGGRRYALINSPAAHAQTVPHPERTNIAGGEFAVAAAPSAWVRPWSDLKRNFFAHWDLAMLTRST